MVTEDILYQTSILLMENLARTTIKIWSLKSLDPLKVLPVFLRLKQPRCRLLSGLMKSLSSCQSQSAETTVHSCHVLAQMKGGDNALLCGQMLELFHIQSALRTCLTKCCIRSCVGLYESLLLYEESVGAALAVDLSLAKEMANLPHIDIAARKRMWLVIAKYLITNQSYAIVESAQILNECQLLSVEDVLPLFPEFIIIDTFKSDICVSLKSYKQNMELFSRDTSVFIGRGSTCNTALTTHEVYSRLSARKQCGLSGCPIVNAPFYHFASGDACLKSALAKCTASGGNRSVDSSVVVSLMINAIDRPLTAAYQRNVPNVPTHRLVEHK